MVKVDDKSVLCFQVASAAPSGQKSINTLSCKKNGDSLKVEFRNEDLRDALTHLCRCADVRPGRWKGYNPWVKSIWYHSSINRLVSGVRLEAVQREFQSPLHYTVKTDLHLNKHQFFWLTDSEFLEQLIKHKFERSFNHHPWTHWERAEVQKSWPLRALRMVV